MTKSPFVFVKNSTFYSKMLQFLAKIFLPQLIKNTFLMHSSTFKTVNILVLEKNFKGEKNSTIVISEKWKTYINNGAKKIPLKK